MAPLSDHDEGVFRGPFQNKLLGARVQGLKLLADALESYDEESEEDFADVIDSVIDHRFSPSELAAEFKVSISTISRWKDRKSCPPAYARRVIVARIREMLVTSISARRRKLEPVSSECA
jgi:hypothetical protein